MTNDDEGLLLKPEPRKPGKYVAMGMAVLALLAVGYFSWGKFMHPAPRDAAGMPAQAPSIRAVAVVAVSNRERRRMEISGQVVVNRGGIQRQMTLSIG